MGATTFPAEAVSPLNKLQFVIQQNEAARSQLESFRYSYQIETDTFPAGQPAEKQVSSGRVVASREGRYGFLEKIQPILDAGSDKVVFEPRANRMVVNDKYSASWSGSNSSVAVVVDHSSFASLSPEIAETLEHSGGEKFEECSFGTTESTLASIYNSKKERHWDLSERVDLSGGKEFAVKLFSPAGGHVPLLISEWQLDADKGFLVTSYKAYRTNTLVGFVRTVDVKCDPLTKLWFPSVIIEKTLRAWVLPPADIANNPHAEELYRERRIHIDGVTLHAAVAKEQFSLEALDIPNGTYVNRTLLDGTTVTSIMSKNVALPADVDQEFKAATKPSLDSLEITEAAPGTIRSSLGTMTGQRSDVPKSSEETAIKYMRPALFSLLFLAGCAGIVVVIMQNRKGG